MVKWKWIDADGVLRLVPGDGSDPADDILCCSDPAVLHIRNDAKELLRSAPELEFQVRELTHLMACMYGAAGMPQDDGNELGAVQELREESDARWETIEALTGKIKRGEAERVSLNQQMDIVRGELTKALGERDQARADAVAHHDAKLEAVAKYNRLDEQFDTTVALAKESQELAAKFKDEVAELEGNLAAAKENTSLGMDAHAERNRLQEESAKLWKCLGEGGEALIKERDRISCGLRLIHAKGMKAVGLICSPEYANELLREIETIARDLLGYGTTRAPSIKDILETLPGDIVVGEETQITLPLKAGMRCHMCGSIVAEEEGAEVPTRGESHLEQTLKRQFYPELCKEIERLKGRIKFKDAFLERQMSWAEHLAEQTDRYREGLEEIDSTAKLAPGRLAELERVWIIARKALAETGKTKDAPKDPNEKEGEGYLIPKEISDEIIKHFKGGTAGPCVGGVVAGEIRGETIIPKRELPKTLGDVINGLICAVCGETINGKGDDEAVICEGHIYHMDCRGKPRTKKPPSANPDEPEVFTVRCYRNGERKLTDKLSMEEARIFRNAARRLVRYLEGEYNLEEEKRST